MSAKRNAVGSIEHTGNNLLAINGLGSKSAEALPSVGIGNCAELAQFLMQRTAEDLSKRLGDQGVSISAKRIESSGWLRQARKHAGQANTKLANPKPEARVAEEGEKTPNQPANPLDEVRFEVVFRRENDRWQVTTYDERRQEPDADKTWGIEPTEWANWILQQMRPHIELELAPTKAEAGVPREIKIEILDVQSSEAERFKKLAAKVHFEVSGSEKEAMTGARTPFWIHVHTLDLTNETVNRVASQRFQLEPEKYEYNKKLQFPIPEVGRYELQSLVLFFPPVGRMALHQGPTFEVVP